MTEPALMTAKQSAVYLGVSKAYFEASIRPYIQCVDLRKPGGKKPMPRFERVELDRHIESRKQAMKARASA
jgi:hypothetical protein